MDWNGLAQQLDAAARACAAFIDAPEPPSREARLEFEDYILTFQKARHAAISIASKHEEVRPEEGPREGAAEGYLGGDLSINQLQQPTT